MQYNNRVLKEIFRDKISEVKETKIYIKKIQENKDRVRRNSLILTFKEEFPKKDKTLTNSMSLSIKDENEESEESENQKEKKNENQKEKKEEEENIKSKIKIPKLKLEDFLNL